MHDNLQTTVRVKTLPAGIQSALASCGYTRRDVDIRGKDSASLVSGSGANTAIAILVTNNALPGKIFHGQFGGCNGFNKPRAKTSLDQWDPDFDQDSKPVPPNGAIVCSSGGRFVYVTVTPATFASLVAPSSAETMVCADASAEGRSEVNALAAAALASTLVALTDDECSVLYAHGCLKSGEYRKRLTKGRETAMNALVGRGLLKRSSNGATQITTSGKAMRTVWDHHKYDSEKCSRCSGSHRGWSTCDSAQ